MQIYRGNFRCSHPFYVFFRKHHCPQCGSKLHRKIVSEMKFPQTIGPKISPLDGASDIKPLRGIWFHYVVFSCAACKKEYSVKDAKKGGF